MLHQQSENNSYAQGRHIRAARPVSIQKTKVIEQDAAEDLPMLSLLSRGEMLHVISQAALERQDLSCTYLAHCELESVLIIIVIIIISQFRFLVGMLTS